MGEYFEYLSWIRVAGLKLGLGPNAIATASKTFHSLGSSSSALEIAAETTVNNNTNTTNTSTTSASNSSNSTNPNSSSSSSSSSSRWNKGLLLVASGCLLLSSKLTEEPLRVRDIINVLTVLSSEGTQPLEIGREYWVLRDSLVAAEAGILNTLAFALSPLTNTAPWWVSQLATRLSMEPVIERKDEELLGSEDRKRVHRAWCSCSATAVSIALDSCIDQSMTLELPSPAVALGAFLLAAQWCGYEKLWNEKNDVGENGERSLRSVGEGLIPVPAIGAIDHAIECLASMYPLLDESENDEGRGGNESQQ